MKEYQIKRAELRAKAIDLLGGVCIKCQTTDGLEFDHIDPSKCNFRISAGITKPWAEVVQEVRLCQLLCKKCHRIKTNKELRAKRNARIAKSSHGTSYMYGTGCRCSDCIKANRQYQIDREQYWRNFDPDEYLKQSIRTLTPNKLK